MASSPVVVALRALLVPRVTLDEYVASPPSRYRDSPVIIRDIVPPDVVESLADELMSVLGDEVVTMQRKTRTRNVVVDGHPRSTATTTTTTYDATLADCVDYMMDSHHDDAYFAFCEGLLPNPPSVSSSPTSRPGRSHELCRKLREIREAPFIGREDWFDRFPPGMRPTDAVILAGSGATSTLHRDPFEWTGTSLCLEGAKVWRFVMPPPPTTTTTTTGGGGDSGGGGVSVVDGALASYRLDSIAWEEEEEEEEEEDDGDDDDDDNRDDDRSRRRPGVGPVVVSAGWQSDMSLYDSIDDDFPSGYDWSIMEEEEGADACAREMERAGSDTSRMRPCPGTLGALDRMIMANSIVVESSSGGGGGGGVGNGLSSPFVTAVQRPGDLLLIPARCWHQTYAPVPSVAVSSQRCGAEADGANVIRHVVDCVAMNRSNDDDGEVKSGSKRKRGGGGRGEGVPPDALKRDRYEEGEGEEIVRRLVEYVRRRR